MVSTISRRARVRTASLATQTRQLHTPRYTTVQRGPTAWGTGTTASTRALREQETTRYFSVCKYAVRTTDAGKLRRKVPTNDEDVTAGGVPDPEQFSACLPKFQLAPNLGPEKTSVRERQAQQLEAPKVKGQLVRLQLERVSPFQTSVSDIHDVGGVGANRCRRRPTARSRQLSSNASDRGAAARANREKMVWQKASACVHPIGTTLNCGKMGVVSSTGTPPRR